MYMESKLVNIWYKRLVEFNKKIFLLQYLKQDKEFRKKFGIPINGFKNKVHLQNDFIKKLETDQVKHKQFIDELIDLASYLKIKRNNEVDMLQKYLLDGKTPVKFMFDSSRLQKKQKAGHTQLWIRIDGLSPKEIEADVEFIKELYPNSFDENPFYYQTNEWQKPIEHHRMYELKQKGLSNRKIADKLSEQQYAIAEQADIISGQEDFVKVDTVTEENVKTATKRYKERMEQMKKQGTD